MAGRQRGTGASASRLQRELEWPREAARRKGFELGVHWADGGDSREHADFLFADLEVLVGDDDLDRTARLLDEEHIAWAVEDSLIGGVTLLGLDLADASHDALESVLELLDTRLGVGVVTPNHVLDVQGWSALCPAVEPVPATVAERWPVAADQTLGLDVRVAVVDTGFISGYDTAPELPWLHDITRFDVDDEVYRDEAARAIAPYGGHGTFVTGVVRSLAPAVSVTVDDVLVGGVVTEAAMVRQLTDALSGSPDVISISAGTFTRKNVPPKALVAFHEHRLRHHKGIALIAAAGNDGGRQPFWPAAFPWAVAVGALTRDGQARTSWTNHGGWVDVYAPGEDLVNAYPDGTYRDVVGGRRTKTFKNRMARWSGTSFATPVVAAMVARRMSSTGQNGAEAAASLLELAQQQFLPGVGPRLLP